jgi:hypothetical protein
MIMVFKGVYLLLFLFQFSYIKIVRGEICLKIGFDVYYVKVFIKNILINRCKSFYFPFYKGIYQ